LVRCGDARQAAPNWCEALEHELAGADNESLSRAKVEGEQPPLTCIGAFSSGRGDLSMLAAEDVFEPRPSR